MRITVRVIAALALAWLLIGCAEEPPTEAAERQPADSAAVPPITDLRTPPPDPAPGTVAAPQVAPDGRRELEWDALIPDDYQPAKLLSEFQIDDLSDDDPRAAEFMDRLKELWDKAPVREDLDGAAIKLPGFVVPVEADENEITGFLLVPYYGACIHVPPPPANQTVYVVAEAGRGAKAELFDVVWVSGTMSIERIENDIAEAGYTLYATEITPYE